MTERYVDQLRREHRARMRRLWPSKRIIPIRCHDPIEPERLKVRKVHPPKVVIITPAIVAVRLPDEAMPPDLTTLDGILTSVCNRHNIDRAVVCSKASGSNKPRVVAARMEYCFFAARDTAQSPRKIGKLISRHRATVVYAIAGYCEEFSLPLPRPGKWDLYRKRKERYRKMRDVIRSVECPTSEQSAAPRQGRRRRSGSASQGGASDSRRSPLAARSRRSEPSSPSDIPPSGSRPSD